MVKGRRGMRPTRSVARPRWSAQHERIYLRFLRVFYFLSSWAKYLNTQYNRSRTLALLPFCPIIPIVFIVRLSFRQPHAADNRFLYGISSDFTAGIYDFSVWQFSETPATSVKPIESMQKSNQNDMAAEFSPKSTSGPDLDCFDAKTGPE